MSMLLAMTEVTSTSILLTVLSGVGAVALWFIKKCVVPLFEQMRQNLKDTNEREERTAKEQSEHLDRMSELVKQLAQTSKTHLEQSGKTHGLLEELSDMQVNPGPRNPFATVGIIKILGGVLEKILTEVSILFQNQERTEKDFNASFFKIERHLEEWRSIADKHYPNK